MTIVISLAEVVAVFMILGAIAYTTTCTTFLAIAIGRLVYLIKNYNKKEVQALW